MNNGQPIGVFDSGVGGLSILIELQKLLPKEDFIFLADQAHVPYGEKSKSQLCKLTHDITNFFIQKGVKLIVVACNTATCHAIDFLRDNFDVPFVGTVPAIKPAAKTTIKKRIGIISTSSTSESDYMANLIDNHAQGIRVVNIGCTGLENAVEKGEVDSLETELLLKKYLEPIKRSGADILVLGCTHYPFLKPKIQKNLDKGVKIVDSSRAIARRTVYLLKESSSLNNRGGKLTYFTTSDPRDFSRMASVLMKKKILAKQIAL